MLKPCSEKQIMMLKNESDVLVLGGSAGSSKSWMLHMIAAKYLDCPNFKATFMRRTTPQLMKPGNLWDTGKKVFNQLGIVNGVNYKPEWRKGEQKLALWRHGPVVEYSHCQHEKDLENYQGSQMTLFAIDEGCQFEWFMIQYLFSRMRSDSKYKSRMLISCNPDPDHEIAEMIDWYLDEDGFPIEEKLGIERYFYVIDDTPIFRDTAEELIKEFPHMAEGHDGQVIPPLSFTFIASTIYDNPVLIKNNPGYLSALKGLNDIDRARLLDGNWKVRPVGVNYFKRENLNKIDKAPFNIQWVRPWDKASAIPTDIEKFPDRTACIKMGKDQNGEFYIGMYTHPDNHDDWEKERYGSFRAKPGKRDNIIRKQAEYDGEEVFIILPVDPGAAGQSEFQESAKKLAYHGFIVKKDPSVSNKSKLTKFSPFAAAVENGFVNIIESSFPNKQTLEYFYKELEAFDGSPSTRKRKDDWVDAVATGYNFLSKATVIPKFSLPTGGTNTNIRKLKAQVAGTS